MPCPIRLTPGLRTSDVTAEPAPNSDVLTIAGSPATAPTTGRGRHAADGTTMPSIRSFVGGRHPRHRVDVGGEFAAFPEPGDGR